MVYGTGNSALWTELGAGRSLLAVLICLHRTRISRHFPQSPKTTRPSKPFAIHCSLIIPPSDAIQSVLLTASLNKTNIQWVIKRRKGATIRRDFDEFAERERESKLQRQKTNNGKININYSLEIKWTSPWIIVQQDATVFSLLYFCRQLYMFRVLTAIIRSWYSCNYSFWSTGTANIRSRCWVGTQLNNERGC